MRTHAWPASAATNGRTASAIATRATPAQTFGGMPPLPRFMRGPLAHSVPRSCAIGDPLAEQAGWTEDEYQYEDEEREHVLVVASEQAHLSVVLHAFLLQRVAPRGQAADVGHVADVAGPERLDDAEEYAAQHRAGQVADAAQHGGGKGFQAEQEAHVVVRDAVVGHHHQ